MDDNLKDVLDEILKITCFFCNKYITVPPIYISKDGLQFRCGRCKDVECEVNNRCLLYENIGKFLKFPCTYKKCTEIISWGEIEKHEKICAYATISCPVYYFCNMEIEREQLVNHVKDLHKQNYFENRFTYNIKPYHNMVSVLEKKGIPFLIFVKGERVYVISIKSNKGSTYNLTLSGSSSPSLLYEHKEINEVYDERIHCCECIAGSCKRTYHPYSSLYDKKNENLLDTYLNPKDLKNLFGNYAELKFTIDIFFDEKIEKNKVRDVAVSTDITNSPVLDTSNNLDIWKNFECPICMEYMIAPIFICQDGHSICSNCKWKGKTCSTCQSGIGSSRNFSLENLANILKVPGSNQKENGSSSLSLWYLLPFGAVDQREWL
nr:uncharacterized protein LOC111502707 [Leptinotarsa decemlineata]